MKKILMFGLICFVFLGSQSIFAQEVPSNNSPSENPVITGKMTRDFAKRISRPGGYMRLPRHGSEKASETITIFNSPTAQYDKQEHQWNIFFQARSKEWKKGKKSWNTWIKYDEDTGLLIISTTKENRNQWTLKKDDLIKVTIADDKSSFRLEFLKDYEGTNDAGYNYNWMKNSWLLVTR